MLQLKHLSDAELVVFRVANFLPQCLAALSQPGIELGERAETALACFDPDASPAVLNVLLDDAFLPAAGDIAEISIDQVMCAHDCKARIDHPPFALLDTVHGRLHVVVDATVCNAAQRRKAARVGVEQHLVALARVGYQPERPAGAQLHVRHLQPVIDPTDHQALFAPVKLVSFAHLKSERHERTRRYRPALFSPPLADKIRQPRIAAVVAGRLELGVKCLGRAPPALDDAHRPEAPA